MSQTTSRSQAVILVVRWLGCSGVLGACLIGAACDDARAVRPAPTQGQPQPAPPQVNTSALAGAYALTIDFSPSCAGIRELAAPRRYQVTMEATPDYLGMRIAGGGYAEPTVVGDLWPGRDGRSALVTWNNFDIPGCDGIPEPLSAGRALMVCGEGGATLNGGVIVAEMAAEVFIETNGVREKVCGDTHRFTFTKATS